ncbi:MAG: hypothetical protein Q7J80_12595 [Anaerolineales bacterium]|nr:hypothetical protein [Anaerolineales bacterium]
MVKTLLQILAVLLIASGGVWLLQGLNLLPGTFMRGNPQWVINGAITAIIGAGLFWFVSRKIK